MGCLELSTLKHSLYTMSSDQIQVLEGKAAMVGSATYVVANAFHIWDSKRGFDLNLAVANKRYLFYEPKIFPLRPQLLSVFFCCYVIRTGY